MDGDNYTQVDPNTLERVVGKGPRAKLPPGCYDTDFEEGWHKAMARSKQERESLRAQIDDLEAEVAALRHELRKFCQPGKDPFGNTLISPRLRRLYGYD